MRVYSPDQIDRNKLIDAAARYAARTTYSDIVKINNGERPLPGDVLRRFNAQLDAAKQYVRNRVQDIHR